MPVVMAAEIRQEVELPFPVERVWKALTDAREVSQWKSTSDIRPVKGARFRLVEKPTPQWDGVIQCEVLEVDAPSRLVYSWQLPGEGLHRVEWTLRATPKGTLLRVRHTGFAEDWFLRAMVTRGYESLLARLPTFLLTGRPQREAYTPTPAQQGRP